MLCGGTSDISKEAHPELQAAVDGLNAELCEKAGLAAGSKLAVVAHSSQVVSGTNYFCKLQVDGGDGHIHARIFQDLPHRGGKHEVHAVQKEHSADSELAYFA